MNKNIKLAVAGAVLALSATAANAGIIIPAGEWTVDLGGNVNMYSSWSKSKSQTASVSGGLATAYNAGKTNGATLNQFGNGLLPNFLSVTGTTRQNDLDVSFTISLQPGSANNGALNQVDAQTVGANGGLNNRQSFITFGDKSWGSVKIGKDLGIFASDAILSDITLLGVGGAYAGAAPNTSLGRIGTGYIYADWKPQIAYSTPNFNGFQATAGISQAFTGLATDQAGSAATLSGLNAAPAYEGKASYSFAANDVTGKIWVSGIAQKVGTIASRSNDDPVAYAGDIGANVNFADFGLTGYYYGGSGVGTTGQMLRGYSTSTAGKLIARDSDGGYVQATYVLPTKTKVALSWGISNLDKASGDTDGLLVKENEQWNAMLIQPLTKHLNLVAEYANMRSESNTGVKNEANTGSLGAILFF